MAMFRLPGWTAERRNALVDDLIERGLPAFAAFRAIYRCDAFWESAAPSETVDQIAARCPNVENIYQDAIWLHHRTLLGTAEQMHQIAEIVAAAVKAA
jgi:3-amino-5-hydroxybenzoate synthase